MEQTARVTFWLFKAKKNVKNQIPIYIRVQFNNEFFKKSTGHSTYESKWDKKSQKVRGANPEIQAINDNLNAQKTKVLMIVNKLILKNQPFSVHTIREHLEGRDKARHSLMSIYNEYLRYMKKLEGRQYAKPTIVKYTNTKLRLSQYLKYKYKRSDIFLYELNFDFISDFESVGQAPALLVIHKSPSGGPG